MKVGIFAGSFNPFHVGHKNILEKAERVFDKVIIAIGFNKDKPETGQYQQIKSILPDHDIEQYGGLLTDYINSKPYPVTLIRGLRNGDDLNYELNLANVLRDVNGGIPLDIAYFTCDREYSHVSSSVVRQLRHFNLNEIYG